MSTNRYYYFYKYIHLMPVCLHLIVHLITLIGSKIAIYYSERPIFFSISCLNSTQSVPNFMT